MSGNGESKVVASPPTKGGCEVTREIKFRAWDVEENIMSESFDLLDTTIRFPLWTLDMTAAKLTNRYERRYLFMQYTGLKDKSGVAICEGDIVEAWFPGMPNNMRVKQEIMLVDGCFGCGDYPLKLVDKISLKVIGNIHQHPHLLTKEAAR
jgi:hypothetical protein